MTIAGYVPAIGERDQDKIIRAVRNLFENGAALTDLPAPSGTKILFQQTTAPVGWTKSTTHDDKALRVVSGTVGSGGSSPFSTVFAKTATNSYTLLTADIPSHSHAAGAAGVTFWESTLGGGSTDLLPVGAQPGQFSQAASTATTGGGGSHAHAMDIRVQYADCIIATKD